MVSSIEGTRDDLTGLYNRKSIVARSNYELDRARRYKHPLSIIILDLDQFKSINAEYGYQGGDNVLKAVADICTGSLRSIDLLGRFGGEEFLICLPETETQGAILTAERIRTNIEAMEIPYEGHKIRITVSIGITGTDCVADENLDCFLKSADRALYAAKAENRNCVRCEMLRMIS
jgi:two-component system cell cycle response regulator